MKGLGQIGFVALVCLVFAASAFSQTVTATLLGTITDAQGAVVAGARVTATEMTTQVSSSRTTNNSGNYEFPNFKPGRYSIAVEMAGFKREIRENVDVVVDTSTFAIRERLKLDIRGESLNFSNTAQFSNPSTSFTSSNFGQITGTRSTGTGVNGTGGGRVIQGGVKVIF
jgi:hypothetical protein